MIQKIRPIIKPLVVLAAVLRAFSLSSFAAAPIAVEIQRLTVSNTQYFNFFGSSVAVAGDWMVVGAPSDDDVASDAGAAYVYRRENEQWVQHVKIYPTGGTTHDNFGQVVAMAGDWMAVGAQHDVRFSWEKGAVYMFQRHDHGTPDNLSDDRWIQEARLLRPDSKANDLFGMSLAMTADGVLVVGSYGNEFLAGSVEVFRYCGGAWNHEKTLVGDDTVPEDWFGSAVDIDGNTVVAGALYNPAGGPSAGTVYVFSFDGTDWHQVDKLVPADSMPGDAFGYAVSIHQDSILVGAIGVDWDWRLGVGAAYFFGKQNGTWVEQQKVQIPNTYGAENFGGGLKLNGNMALIGSSRAYADGNKESVRLWSKCNGHWYMQQKIQPGDLIGSEFFGAGMVLEDQQIIISSLAAVRVYNLEDGLSLESYSFLQRCWSGDNDIIDPGCSSFDFDHNGKIDLLDYSELSTCWINP